MKRTLWTCVLIFLPCLLIGGEENFLSPSVRMVDRYGAPMRGFLSENNTYYYPVTLGEVSPWLLAAAVSAEDKRFYQHSGVDARAVLRAFFQNTQEGEIVSGASTITQQLVRAVDPRPKTWWGKTQEAVRAGQWEKTHTKEEILEEYFNRVEFGNLTQGVEAAAQFYFGVPAAKVSLSQAAFLVGLIKSPTYYNPLKNFSRALKRRDYVLKRMRAEQWIDEEMYQLAREEEIVLQQTVRPFEAPHFTHFLRTLLPASATQVRTTLDKELQLYAEKRVKTAIQKLQEENVTNGAAVVLDNQTGAVLAYVGSADFYNDAAHGQVDGVRALRQPGSALKPFVYGAGFEKGVLTPATLLADEDTFFEGGFRPRNYDENFHGFVSARSALACSYNIPAVKVAEEVGAAAVLDVLHKAGLTELDRPADYYGLGLALGNGEVQLLHLAGAYAALARGGEYKPLTLSQEPRVQVGGKNTRVLSETAAYLVTHILADNHARAAAFGLNSALSVPFEMAAKTGTSKDYKDNFALAYTPRWTIGVWVGNFDASPMRRVSGVTGAGPILHDLAIYVNQKYPASNFAEPAGVRRAVVCTQTGLRAGPACKHTQEEVFAAQHVPAVCDGKHAAAAAKLTLLAPAGGDVYQYDPAIPAATQKMKWHAACRTDTCVWTLNGQKQPQTSCRIWWPLTAGKHRLEVSCGGETATVTFEVLP